MHTAICRAFCSCIVLFVLFLFGNEAWAQVSQVFDTGYVVTADGDSLRGDLIALPEVLATREVRFRPEGQRRIVRYAPQALRAAGTDIGRRYETHRLVPGQHEPEQTLLLLTLLDGPVSLFAYSYDDRSTHEERRLVAYRPDRFAIRTESGEILPLYVRVEQRRSDGRESARELWGVQQYVSRLAQAFSGCEATRAGVEAIPFRQEALLEAVTAYNDCVGGSSRRVSEGTPRARQRIGPLAIRLGSGAYALQEQGRETSGRGMHSTLSLQISITPLPAQSQLTLPVELSISNTSIDAGWRTAVFDGRDFSGTRLGGAVGVRYTLPVAPVAPFLGAGAQIIYAPRGEEMFIAFPQPHAGVHSVPDLERGTYLEVGGFGSRGWQQRLGVGLRYDATTQQAPRQGGRSFVVEGQGFSGFIVLML